uniref:Phage holin family protein n=1 Tax=Chlorobium chlorochromatii (strain CaD3) TaxID=340177 RepID=Q3AQH4_CHLCH
MLRLLLQWLINALAVYATAQILEGIHIRGFATAIAVALVFGLINTLVRPVLLFFSFPVIVLTLGLFLLVINALLLQLAALLVGGFSIDGFWWAVAGSVVISAISWLLSSLFRVG